MNQILSTNLKENNKLNNSNQKQEKPFKKVFKIQFSISITIIIISVFCCIFYIYSLKNNEKISKNLIGNYNIYRLYSDIEEKENQESTESNIFGIIEIPKINIYYTIFSNLTEDNLKISPCKFYGGTLKDNTNICIAGHNYNNDMFFSKINLLQLDDEIYIYDNAGEKYTYFVTENYEVKEDDLSPILDYNKNQKNLTLITCNNLNNNRYIIKAVQKSSQ